MHLRTSVLSALALIGCGTKSAPPVQSGPSATPGQPAPQGDAIAPSPSSLHGAWTAAPVTHALPGDEGAGQTYFRDERETQSGTFRVMYESALDTRDKVTGPFRVASFRYVYAAPIGAEGAMTPIHDESIHTLLLDCAQGFAGTRLTVYKLRGAIVKEQPDPDPLMTQSTMPSTVSELCAFLTSR